MNIINIIGIVGPMASGKGVVVDYLVREKGFVSFSLSSIVHDELKRRGIVQFDRTVLQDVGDDLRKREGDDALVKRAMKKLQVTSYKLQNIVIEGIRNPGEVTYLRTIPGFTLISVDAPQKIRYERILTRGKPWDPKDWKSFMAVDVRDSKDTENKSGQQVRTCMEMADIHIENDGDISQLCTKIKKSLSVTET